MTQETEERLSWVDGRERKMFSLKGTSDMGIRNPSPAPYFSLEKCLTDGIQGKSKDGHWSLHHRHLFDGCSDFSCESRLFLSPILLTVDFPSRSRSRLSFLFCQLFLVFMEKICDFCVRDSFVLLFHSIPGKGGAEWEDSSYFDGEWRKRGLGTLILFLFSESWLRLEKREWKEDESCNEE